MSKSLIACRLSSYAPYEQLALEHLASLGIHCVEAELPPPAGVDELRSRLDRFGLTAISLHGRCPVAQPAIAAQIEQQMPAFQALGAKYMFVSVRADDTPLPTVYARLREAGDIAARHGVTIVMETHPDLVTNAAVALATMQNIGHPNVRVNFDTANIYFYNRNVNTADELRHILPYVASLHLKDTDGGYKSWHFPALGRGVVPFAQVFATLDGAGFSGPCTLEIEGIEGEQKTQRLVCDRVAESLGYLRGLGRL